MEFTAILAIVIVTLLAFGGTVAVAGAMSLAERRVSAWMQYRIGPSRVGPLGLLQPIADLIKFMFKEEVMPEGAHPLLFRLAPILSAVPAMMTFAVVPFGLGKITIPGLNESRPLVVADIPVGAIYFLAVGSLGVYGIILGGWASNNKFSLLGSIRSGAQMLSYELSLTLSMAAAILMSGSLQMTEIVKHQAEHGWNILYQPVAFIIFLIAMFAETNRHPFDFAECEPELVGGFHTEYSSMKFAMFFVGEYCAMFAMSGMITTLFLGGPLVPFLPIEQTPWWLSVIAFAMKSGVFLFLYLWVRWSLPRFKYDQLMDLGWKKLLPVALLNFAVTGTIVVLANS
ncbi:MAG: NADH-quinone oxidoreductase subunit NuoH [Planctomycetes bacterium]|nr:NADH-quinone oxidoreductase subunit NuoH [Planctomycetota bacterium]